MSAIKTIFAATLLASAQLVAGHGAIISATGDAGGKGMALGVVSTTPRDGTQRDPFQQDSTRFRGASAATFGETVGAGANQLDAGTKAIMSEMGGQLPQITPGGSVNMMLHQVNGDGGGPYTCEMNSDGTGTTWENINVSTTPPGQNSRNRAGAETDFPMVADVPAGQTCTGNVAGQDNVCLVRCMNAARAGPFGGVVPVQMAGTTTPAQARALLARSILESEKELYAIKKRSLKARAELQDFEIEEEKEDAN